MHGIGWEQEAIDYFESKIGVSWFPGAHEKLTFCSTGGVVYCTNGMHRLVAAVAWLAATKGAAATLRKALVTVHSVHAASRRFILDHLKRGLRVDVGRIAAADGTTKITAFRIPHKHSADFYLVDGDDVRPTGQKFSLADRFKLFRNPTSENAFAQDWHTVTPRIAEALRNDGWLEQQLSMPVYADTPA